MISGTEFDDEALMAAYNEMEHDSVIRELLRDVSNGNPHYTPEETYGEVYKRFVEYQIALGLEPSESDEFKILFLRVTGELLGEKHEY